MNEIMRDVKWIGDSREQVQRFPKPVRRIVGQALNAAQSRRKHINAKPLRGVGSGVLEITARYDTNTYRAVYAIRIGKSIYVLHAFQKKSTRGVRTPKKEIDLIKQLLKVAQEMEEKNE